MKTAMLAVSLVSVLAVSAPATSKAAGQDFDLTHTDFSTWNLAGDAALDSISSGGYIDKYLRLTTHGFNNQAGAAWAGTPQIVDFNQDFQFDFRFFVHHGNSDISYQGDGLTFFITGSQPPAVGMYGGDLGYGQSGMSGYAFAVDTFSWSGDEPPKAVSVQILKDGSVSPLAYTETGLFDIQSPGYYQWNATVTFTASGDDDEKGSLQFSIYQGYSGETYSVSLADADWSGVAFDVSDDDGNPLGRGINIGFSAGNGGADDGHFIGSRIAAPVPEPQVWAMMFAGLGVVGWRLRRART